jgi:hypothetical protein
MKQHIRTIKKDNETSRSETIDRHRKNKYKCRFGSRTVAHGGIVGGDGGLNEGESV